MSRGMGAGAGPALSVIVNFHNMRREAERTLYTLSARYQRNVREADYEVIAVDNGSGRPLDPASVHAHGGNFRYHYYRTDSKSPCSAINWAVSQSLGGAVMVCIDGARMLSPGVIRYVLDGLAMSPHPFIYTLGMHLGAKPQNELLEEGYDQKVEDRLLETVDWRNDGYRLFSLSSLAYSSRNGFFSMLSESNCFALPRSDYDALGGMDERFDSAGGGLVNLDFFNRANELAHLRPFMILGEATFHQFHGGVATNVLRSEHPWQKMAEEYARIRGLAFSSVSRKPEYLGWLSKKYHAGLIKQMA